MRRAALLFVPIVFLVACGSSNNDTDEGVNIDVNVNYDNGGTDIDNPPPDANNPDDSVTPDTSSDVVLDTHPQDIGEITRVITLQVDQQNPIPVAINQQFTFRGQVKDATSGAPVPNPAVSFTITYVEDTEKSEEVLEYDSWITRPSTVGDAEGRVSSTFQAGETPKRLYTITVHSDGAVDQIFKILVEEMDCSCSNVTLTYDGVPGDGASYHVLAFDSSHTCAELLAADELPAAAAEINHGDIATPAKIPCLTPGATYTVLVTAAETCPFAKGCAEGVTVGAANDGENCGAGTVALDGIEVAINKQYDGKHKFTFTNVIPACTFSSSMDCSNVAGRTIGQQACCYLNSIQELFADNGADFANAAADQAGLEGAARTTAVNAISDWVSSKKPAWAAKAASMGAMVRNVIVQTNMTSKLKIEAPDGEGNFQGSEDWRTFVLYWKLDCDPSDPNYYNCGKFEISQTAIGGISYSPAISKSTFGGSLGIANNFAIAHHQINLNPGRLLVYVANKVAAVTLTGGYINASQELITVGAAADLKDAYKRWIACATMAADLASTAPAITEAVCNAAVDVAMADITAGHNALVADSYLSLAGNGAYTDATCDGFADELSAGRYTGTWVRGQTEIEMEGTFSGIDE